MTYSTFAKVEFRRTGPLHYSATVLSPVVCKRDGKKISSSVLFGFDDVLTKRLPKLFELRINGDSFIKKIRLSTIGYDSCDRAIIKD